MANDGVIKLERVLELGEGLVVALDIHEHVVRLVDLVDRVGELAAAPVFEAVNAAVAGGDHLPVTVDHRRDLLALVRMDDENDFVMTHQVAPCGLASRHAWHGEARAWGSWPASGLESSANRDWQRSTEGANYTQLLVEKQSFRTSRLSYETEPGLRASCPGYETEPRLRPLSNGAGTLALAARLRKADPGGDRYVQALDAAEHRDAHELVAMLAREAPHALPVGAGHPRAR